MIPVAANAQKNEKLGLFFFFEGGGKYTCTAWRR